MALGIAGRMARRTGRPVEDLIGPAAMALCAAAADHDPGRVASFRTYAFGKVAGYIRHHIRDEAALRRRAGALAIDVAATAEDADRPSYTPEQWEILHAHCRKMAREHRGPRSLGRRELARLRESFLITRESDDGKNRRAAGR